MNIPELEAAIEESKKFIDRGNAVIRKHKEYEKTNNFITDYVISSRESGALRRTSMELTNLLAEMRKP